ncbi:MAG: hypothetical protein ACC657_16875 [Thiohalomonadales bacterium]
MILIFLGVLGILAVQSLFYHSNRLTKNVHLSNPAYISQAIEWQRQGLDFSDSLHLTQCQQCEKLYTFDNEFSKKSNNLSNCSVTLP